MTNFGHILENRMIINTNSDNIATDLAEISTFSHADDYISFSRDFT